MTRRLVLSYLAVTLFVLLVLELPLAVVFDRAERNDLVSRVKQDALVVAQPAADVLHGEAGVTALRDLAVRYRSETGGRVIVVDMSGTAVVDPADEAGSFSNRPEIVKALSGTVVTGWRHSGTLGTELLYVAVPVSDSGNVVGAVRITFPASAATSRIHRVWIALAGIGALILALVLGLGVALARSLTRPLRTVADTAREMGKGNLKARATVAHGPPEVATLAETINETGARLEALVDAQQAFIADASHQLRNPLAALRLHLENVQAEVDGEASDEVDRALAEAMRLSRLVDGLLALARSEQHAAERSPTNIAEVLAGRLAMWEPLASEQDVHLSVTADPHSTALVSEGHLEQVLDNLIANALDAAPQGSEVALTAEPRGQSAEIHVTDHGPGIPAEQRASSLGRYWRSPRSTSARFGGSGLGLAIARRLVEADRGTLELGDTPGGGLDVTISLPAPRRHESRRAEAVAQ